MKSLEEVYNDIYYKLSDKELVEEINDLQNYIKQLITIRPQRAYKLMNEIEKFQVVKVAIDGGNISKEHYERMVELTAELHRTSKIVKRQMKQQFGKEPNYPDVDEVVGECKVVLDFSNVINEMRV